jgi:CPA1 family monovalent cation:H+ antiporter
MSPFELFATLTTLAALFSWLNHRLLRLPTTIGLMALSLLFSLGLVILGHAGFSVEDELLRALGSLDFADALLNAMLGALLFAGALHVDLGDLSRQRGVIAVLATVGVLISTVLVAGLSWLAFGALGVELPWLYCLVFGALIAPTDPVAVLGILKGANVPATLETKIAGESLFNDGIGIVVFLVVVSLAAGGAPMGPADVVALLAREALGGVVFGLLLGGGAYWLLRAVDDYHVEVLVTLAVVTGGYALAQALHTSGPLALVVAGLFIGNRGRMFAMSEHTRERLDSFWELIDEFLNALLFVMIGLEVVVIGFDASLLAAGALAIPAVLAARFVSIGLPIRLLRRWRSFSPHAIAILTWGGLRGGISVALALSLPAGPERDVLLAVTYTVVCFSILVQGLSMAPLVAWLYRPARENRTLSP